MASREQCPCDREKRVDPWCCVAGECVRDEEEETDMERAILGVDGNCGFARLGPNLQDGEAEFEPIKDFGKEWHAEQHRQAKIAINKALQRLRERLYPQRFSYALHPSHPDYC